MAGQNRGALKVFGLRSNHRTVPVQATDVSALIRYKNGKTQKQEFYYGASFLSQSGRFLLVNDSILSIEITDYKNNRRKFNLN